MLAKIALRNIRRSLRDYAIYFVTIVLGVAVFYAFNSIGSQQLLFDLNSSTSERMFEMTDFFMRMFSVVVAFVLGFLVIYANRFLIKRRQHEFGTYLLLGMDASRVSFIVLLETVVVGIVSLAVGLLAGFALSQGLSFVTAALFGTTMKKYEFVFSSDALFVTLACFALIYLVVALFNLLTVNRFKLIDLFSARSRSEKNPVRNPRLCFAGFLVSLAVIVAAYWNLKENGLVMLDDPRLAWATGFMLLGTFLFFWSLAGFAVAVLTKADGVYLKGLRMFTVRQIASKINTAFVSLWAVCVMLFFSVTVFSSGMGLMDVFTTGAEAAAPYDASLRADLVYASNEEESALLDESVSALRDLMARKNPEVFQLADAWGFNALAKLSAEVPGWDDLVEDAAEIDYYRVPGASFAPLLELSDMSEDSLDLENSLADETLVVAGLSQFNATRALAGQDPVVLDEGECLVNNTMDMTQDIADAAVANGPSLTLLGRSFTVSDETCSTQTVTAALESSALEIVVPDSFIDDLKAQGAIPSCTYTNIMYREPGEATDMALREALDVSFVADAEAGFYGEDGVEIAQDAVSKNCSPGFLWPSTMHTEKSQMIAQAYGLRMMITYLAVYVGFVLLVATAAVLAVQQLSETADSMPRYRTLSKLGCDDRMIRRSLLQQVLVYFLTPLGLAVCHAACAIYVLEGGLFKALGSTLVASIGLAAVLVIAIYGCYLLLTYFACRSMVTAATK